MPVNADAAYVEIIHLSDLHFGPGHVFTPEPTPDNRKAASTGTFTLAEKVIEDLKDEATSPFPKPENVQDVVSEGPEAYVFDDPEFPRILCLSGDFTQTGAADQFQQAETLVLKFKEDAALRIPADGVFVCPGNHDLAWDKTDDSLRWQAYASFLSALTDRHHHPKNARLFGGAQICHGARTVVLSLNTEIEVAAVDGNKARGDLDPGQLAFARDQIKALPPEVKRDYVKVAMVHHHPVLLPWSAEAGRGYDAIHNAEKLLSILHEYQFHVVLHGHKHYPHTYREDVRSAFKQVPDHSLFFVGGGTCGSSEFVNPRPASATQAYNRIRIHWCAREQTTRVQVATRGLVRFNASGNELLPDEWRWRTLRIDDRHEVARRRPDVAPATSMRYLPPVTKDSPANAARIAEYGRTRGCFPVAETFPAMLPGQTAEVHLRIVRHSPPLDPKHDLEAVTWSAGPKFRTVRVTRAEDPEFGATFAYYGGALFQAEMSFADESLERAHVYVPLLNRQAVKS